MTLVFFTHALTLPEATQGALQHIKLDFLTFDLDGVSPPHQLSICLRLGHALAENFRHFAKVESRKSKVIDF